MIVSQGRAKLSTLERLALIRQLSELPLTQLGQIEFALNVPKSVMPGMAAPVGDRAKALLDWADGPTGVGLGVVYEVAQQIIPTLRPLEQSDPTGQSLTVHLVITLAGDADEMTLDQLLTLLNELRHKSHNDFLEIMKIDSGDGIRCIINGSSYALNSLKTQHQLGWCQQLLNRPVLSVEFEYD